MGYIVKLFRHENPLVSCEWRRFGKTGMVDVVCRAPGAIHPMRTGFEDVVLKIILIEQHQPALIANIGKFFEPRPIPRIEFRQVVAAEAVPSRALAAARKRLFIKRGPDIAVHPAHALVILAAAVVPETVMVIERRLVSGNHRVRQFIQVVGITPTGAPRRKSRQCGTVLRSFAGPHIALPPIDLQNTAGEQPAIANQPTVRKHKGFAGCLVSRL